MMDARQAIPSDLKPETKPKAVPVVTDLVRFILFFFPSPTMLIAVEHREMSRLTNTTYPLLRPPPILSPKLPLR